MSEIADGLFELEVALGDKRLALWIGRGPAGACIVDTGVRGVVIDAVLPTLDRLGIAPGEVIDVVFTHADVDHHGGAAEARAAFPRARLRAGVADRSCIESWAAILAERYGWFRGHGLDYEPSVWTWLPGTVGPDTPIDGPLRGRDAIALGGGMRLEVIELPGHTRGHIGLWEPQAGVAIIADAALAGGVPDASGRICSPPMYVSASAYRSTLRTLAQLPIADLRTAHFPPAMTRDVQAFLAESADFVNRLDACVSRACAQSRPELPRLLAVAMRELGPYPALGVELARSIYAHLVELG